MCDFRYFRDGIDIKPCHDAVPVTGKMVRLIGPWVGRWQPATRLRWVGRIATERQDSFGTHRPRWSDQRTR